MHKIINVRGHNYNKVSFNIDINQDTYVVLLKRAIILLLFKKLFLKKMEKKNMVIAVFDSMLTKCLFLV